RLACEEAWQASGLPLQILRLPGIYGPGRSVLKSVNTGQSRMIHKPNQVFSRIHVDDIAGAILHLIQCAADGQRPIVINVTDDMPTAYTDVLGFAAQLLGKSLPEIEPFAVAAAQMNPMALSFWQENRRVSNQLLCRELGYSLMHPNYQSGLRDCYLAEGFKVSQTNFP
ncbi:MAG: SDR family NAD(P)-dependent oxidoreductase, partial [Cyanobacteriota bacterium]|nr:SDR family NAD(P)-dependent oxidoreductase [Cyanobacteriota bacterium]